jgi:hypothetical protein
MGLTRDPIGGGEEDRIGGEVLWRLGEEGEPRPILLLEESMGLRDLSSTPQSV